MSSSNATVASSASGAMGTESLYKARMFFGFMSKIAKVCRYASYESVRNTTPCFQNPLIFSYFHPYDFKSYEALWTQESEIHQRLSKAIILRMWPNPHDRWPRRELRDLNRPSHQ